MLCTEGLLTKGAQLATSMAAICPTSLALGYLWRCGLTDRTRLQTIQTVGNVGNGLIKANTDMFATGLASDQAIMTEALTTCATYVRVRTILMATRTAHGTSGADQRGLAAAGQHMVDA
jgi:hypothetical protein